MEEDTRQPLLEAELAVSLASRNPKKRFVGRRTAEAQAQARHKAEASGSVEEGSNTLQKGNQMAPSSRAEASADSRSSDSATAPTICEPNSC